jgi:hypothetical protein
MAISKKTQKRLAKLNDSQDRSKAYAKDFMAKLPAKLRPSQKKLLYHLLYFRGSYFRLNTLCAILCPKCLSTLDDGRDVVDACARSVLQTAIFALRKVLSDHFLDIREAKEDGDRRVKAYGLFHRIDEDTQAIYLENTKLVRQYLEYSPRVFV